MNKFGAVLFVVTTLFLEVALSQNVGAQQIVREIPAAEVLNRQAQELLAKAEKQAAEAKLIWDKRSAKIGAWNAKYQMGGDADFNTPDPRDAIAYQAEIADLRREAKQLDGEVSRLRKEARAAQKASQAFYDEAAKANASERARIQALSTAVQSIALNQSFDDLLAVTQERTQTIQALDNFYDNAVLGAYLKEKFRALLTNRHPICSAVDACAKPAAPVNVPNGGMGDSSLLDAAAVNSGLDKLFFPNSGETRSAPAVRRSAQ